MADSLLKEPQAVAAYPWRYAYRKEDTSLNRYFALMGANDPVAWWLGKADRQGWGSDKWQLSGEAEDKGKYWLVKFNLENMPTLGDNGVLVWREKLMKAKVDDNKFVEELEKLGVIYTEDMLPETAYIKLGWILGHTQNSKEVKHLIQTNIAGEINRKLSEKDFLY